MIIRLRGRNGTHRDSIHGVTAAHGDGVMFGKGYLRCIHEVLGKRKQPEGDRYCCVVLKDRGEMLERCSSQCKIEQRHTTRDRVNNRKNLAPLSLYHL